MARVATKCLQVVKIIHRAAVGNRFDMVNFGAPHGTALHTTPTVPFLDLDPYTLPLLAVDSRIQCTTLTVKLGGGLARILSISPAANTAAADTSSRPTFPFFLLILVLPLPSVSTCAAVRLAVSNRRLSRSIS